MPLISFDLARGERGRTAGQPYDAGWAQFLSGLGFETVGTGAITTATVSPGAGFTFATGADQVIRRASFDGAATLGSDSLASPALVTFDWTGTAALAVTLNAAWNTIKNFQATSFDGTSLKLTNWVDVDLRLDDAIGRSVAVEGAKRGNIALGGGNDTLTLGVDSNGSGAGNGFSIATGAGNDTITIGASATNHTGGFYGGTWTSTSIDAGSGDDVITGWGSRDTVDGGTGLDIFVLRGLKAGYSINTSNGVTTVTDINTADGNDAVDTLRNVETIRFGDGSTLSLVAPPPPPAPPTGPVPTLTVGAGKQFATLSAALAASKDGDVIGVSAGTYYNDFANVNTKVTIMGVGGMAHFVATGLIPNGKGILVTNTDVTIDGLGFSGAKVADANGAGIRYQAGNLVVKNSLFADNQNGILGNSSSGTITIEDSEFARNGDGSGYTHGIYVNTIARLSIDDSYLHSAKVGHQVKSRALETVITDSRIFDLAGTASYSIDLPNGGRASLVNNVIQQGSGSQNPAIVHFGGEGAAHAGSSLAMLDNVVTNNLASGSARMLLNQTTVTASITGTDVFGLPAAQLASGPASIGGTIFLGAAPVLDTSSPWSLIA